jgi:hypothetical protein
MEKTVLRVALLVVTALVIIGVGLAFGAGLMGRLMP